jgi:Protein of unknown function (DUF2844)
MIQPRMMLRRTPIRSTNRWHVRLMTLVLLLLLRSGWAALGEAPAASLSSGRGGYTVHEAVYDNGTRVQEFVAPNGVVFAVAWEGPVLPDLTLLLGRFYANFKLETEQIRLSGQRGGPVSMARDGLVLRSSGRMRNYFGHAYAPALVPAGLNIKTVLP